jgi:uncharacterized membrane protein
MISLFKLRVILTISAVFLLGAVAGASWSGILVSRNAAAQLSTHPSKPGVIEELKTRLKLSPGQMQQIDLILDETQREFSQLHRTVKPQFEEIRQTMRSGIRQILNEEQEREYEVMIRERDEQKGRQEQDKIR